MLIVMWMHDERVRVRSIVQRYLLVAASRGRCWFTVMFMLSQSFFNGDALINGLFLSLLALDLLVMGKMLEILRMVVGLVCLCLWCVVELLWSELMSYEEQKPRTKGAGEPSWWRKNSVWCLLERLLAEIVIYAPLSTS